MSLDLIVFEESALFSIEVENQTSPSFFLLRSKVLSLMYQFCLICISVATVVNILVIF